MRDKVQLESRGVCVRCSGLCVAGEPVLKALNELVAVK